MVIARTLVELAQIRKLLYSVRTSNYEQIQRFYEKGIDGIINYNDPQTGIPKVQKNSTLMKRFLGETPLLIAVQNNDEKMVATLIRLGAHPDGTDFQV